MGPLRFNKVCVLENRTRESFASGRTQETSSTGLSTLEVGLYLISALLVFLKRKITWRQVKTTVWRKDRLTWGLWLQARRTASATCWTSRGRTSSTWETTSSATSSNPRSVRAGRPSWSCRSSPRSCKCGRRGRVRRSRETRSARPGLPVRCSEHLLHFSDLFEELTRLDLFLAELYKWVGFFSPTSVLSTKSSICYILARPLQHFVSKGKETCHWSSSSFLSVCVTWRHLDSDSRESTEVSLIQMRIKVNYTQQQVSEGVSECTLPQKLMTLLCAVTGRR